MRALKRPMILLAAVLLLTALFPASAFADVTTLTGYSSDSDVITLAGCPDDYPYEYYDADSGTYKGIFPDLLELISSQTELDFAYVYADTSDARLLRSKSGKVDIVSDYDMQERQMSVYLLTAGPVVFPGLSGEPDVGFAFTQYCETSDAEAFTKALADVTNEQLLEIIRPYLVDNSAAVTVGVPTPAAVIPAVLAVLFLFFALRMAARVHQLKKERYENESIDALTGLPNAKGYADLYEKKVARQFRARYTAIFFSFDIIKCNNVYGNSASEDQLRAAVSNLKTLEKPDDILARVSGSGLLFLKPFTDDEAMEKWLKSALEMLNEYCTQYKKPFKPFFSAGTYSVGVGEWDSAQVLENASWACRCADAQGVPYFISDHKSIQQKNSNVILRDTVLEAMDRGQFIQYVQPIVGLDEQKIVGGETLSRWEHPELGILRPGRFVDMMESEGIAIELDMHMFEQACRTQSRWQQGGRNLFLTTNFTRATICEPDFLTRLQEITAKYEFDHHSIIIEITEDCLGRNGSAGSVNIRRCRELGFRIALDDLGSGYTFFADLKDYELDIIKLDRSLIVDAETPKGYILIEQISAMCRALGIEVLCEGVETEAQLEIAKKIGCRYIQGFYYYRPMPQPDYEQLIDR